MELPSEAGAADVDRALNNGKDIWTLEHHTKTAPRQAPNRQDLNLLRHPMDKIMEPVVHCGTVGATSIEIR